MKSPTYTVLFKAIVLIDMIAETTLWIAGAYTHYQTNEHDQIIKFHFTESVFDILIMSSFKAMLFYILICELESACIQIAIHSAAELRQETNSAETTTTTESTTDTTTNQHDQESLIHSSESNLGPVTSTQKIRKLMHLLIIGISLASFLYTVIKFSLILKAIVAYQDGKRDKLPMDYYFFAAICTELVLCFIQLIFATLSWKCMRAFTADVQRNQNVEANSDNEPKKVNIKRLVTLSYPERYVISIAFIMLVISSATNVLLPVYFKLIIDAAMNYDDLAEMNKYIVYMFLVYFIGAISGGIRSWLFEIAGQRVVARLRNSVFSAIIRQDIEFFDTNRTGELTSRISSDTQVVQNAVTVNMSMLARYIVQILGSIFLMFSLEPSLTGLLLAVVPVVSLSAVRYGKYLKNLRKKFQDELAASSTIAEETISSARTVRSFAAENKVMKSYKANIDRSYQIGVKLGAATGGFIAFTSTIVGGAISVILWYGGKLVHEEKISTGTLFSFLIYTIQVAMAFAFLSSLYGDFMQALGASQRIFELLDRKPKIPSGVGIVPKNEDENETTFDGSLAFDNVDFTYSSRPDTKILKNVTFTVEKNKCIAFVGPSGGGKSTIFSMIERFYNPDSGDINLGQNKIPISSVDTNWLHSKISLVAQEPVLLGGTIKENIAFGRDLESINMTEIEEVSKLANALEFISGLEQGFDTIVGERGIRLSGGQKQRIAIARALLMNPKLLLLDEATSALDSESEHLVQEAIDRAMSHRTVCVIAHRLSTVRNADRVVVIDKGEIVETGTHDELCAIDGVYKKLVLRQLLSKDKLDE